MIALTSEVIASCIAANVISLLSLFLRGPIIFLTAARDEDLCASGGATLAPGTEEIVEVLPYLPQPIPLAQHYVTMTNNCCGVPPWMAPRQQASGGLPA